MHINGQISWIQNLSGSSWYAVKGSAHLTLQQHNLAMPLLCPWRVCVCVCVWGMGVKRTFGTRVLCRVFWSRWPHGRKRQHVPADSNSLIRIFTSAAYTHSSPISHTNRTPLAEDTHTHRGSLSAVVGVRCYTHIKSANLMRSLSSNIRFLNGGHS